LVNPRYCGRPKGGLVSYFERAPTRQPFCSFDAEVQIRESIRLMRSQFGPGDDANGVLPEHPAPIALSAIISF
jgi:hypothetical protein